MYNKSAVLILLFFAPLSGMTEPGTAHDSVCDCVSISMSRNLYDFFALKLGSLKSVSQTTYDQSQQMAHCEFKYKRNRIGLLKDDQLVCFLNSNTVPNTKQKKQINLVLPAFVKLNQFLDTNFIMFNKLQTGVILNPVFAKIPDPDMRTCFESMAQSARICAAIAGISFLD